MRLRVYLLEIYFCLICHGPCVGNMFSRALNVFRDVIVTPVLLLITVNCVIY